MFRYIRAKQTSVHPQAMSIYHQGRLFGPVFHHAAIDQNHPVGDRRTFREHTHDLYHIVLYTQHRGQYSKCGRKYVAEPGVLVLISPGQPHDFVSDQRSSVYSEVTFSLEARDGAVLTVPLETVLTLYTGVAVRLQSEPRLDRNTMRELLVDVIQIADYLNSPSDISRFHAHRTLSKMLETIVANCCTEKESAVHTVLDDRLVRVKQYLEEHYTEAIRIDDLVSLCHTSRGHLFRSFKEAFLISPMAYQQNLRLEAARTLLRSTTLRCNEIAGRVGYENVYFFHRLFKNKTGVSPNKFRKSVLKPARGSGSA